MVRPRLYRLSIILRLLATRLAVRSPKFERLACWNRMFDKRLLPALVYEKCVMESFDARLFEALNSRRFMGQMWFEYGMLVNWQQQWHGVRVLDIGPGQSTFGRWMAAQGAHVTALEAPNQGEPPVRTRFSRLSDALARAKHVRVDLVPGDMREMPFPDDAFDLVTAFSVVEHLDTDFPSLDYVPYPEQQRRLAQTLREIIRVTKPGGHFYVSTECCDFDRAQHDAFDGHYFKKGRAGDPIPARFSSVWPVKDVIAMFYDFVVAHGCVLPGGYDFDPRDLDGSDERSIFRGPFFSSFCLLAHKPRRQQAIRP